MLFSYKKIRILPGKQGKEKSMGEFRPINTQEELDAVLGERLRRERESHQKKLEESGWLSKEAAERALKELNDKVKALESSAAATQKVLEEKDEKIAEGEKYRADLAKTRIASAAGLKLEYADRLRGDTEEEWKEDAEILAKDFKASHLTPPIGNPEPENNSKPDPAKKFAAWMDEVTKD